MAKEVTQKKLDELRVRKTLDTVDFFEEVDLKETSIDTFTKPQLLILISELNRLMISSVENWDGG